MKKIILFILFTVALNAGIHVECIFNKYADEQGVKEEKDFIVKFEVYDNGEAIGVGNNGFNPVILNTDETYEAQSFIESTPNGSLAIVTINKKTGNAVYSRNMILLGKLFPSQHYGSCSYLNGNTVSLETVHSVIPVNIQSEISKELNLIERVKSLEIEEISIVLKALQGKAPSYVNFKQMSQKGRDIVSEIAIVAKEKMKRYKKQ